MQSGVDAAQGRVVGELIDGLHHIMWNGGPGTGKTQVMVTAAARAKENGWGFLGTGSTDQVVGNLRNRGLLACNLQRLLVECKNVKNGWGVSTAGREIPGLKAFLAAFVAPKNRVVLAIDECGLVRSTLFDSVLRAMEDLRPGCFAERRALLYLTGDFANQLPPVGKEPEIAFVFSREFRKIRENTFFPYMTKQYRFDTEAQAREVAELLAASDRELQLYLRAQQWGYRRCSAAALAKLPTFTISRRDCEDHHEAALQLSAPDAQHERYVVQPATGHEGSTESATTRATYYVSSEFTSVVEVTTMGGALGAKTEEGDEVSIPNRHACELLQLFDCPAEATADALVGRGSASLLYRAQPDDDGVVVTVPLVHKLDEVACVTLRTQRCFADDETLSACYVAFNEQGREHPGRLVFGCLGCTGERQIPREALLVVATRTPLGPTETLFHPNVVLKAANAKEQAAYWKQLGYFTPDPSGNGRTTAVETPQRKRPSLAAFPPRPGPSAPARQRVSFLGRL